MVGLLVRSESRCSSCFPGDVFSQKGRKAVGHGHRDKEAPSESPSPTARRSRPNRRRLLSSCPRTRAAAIAGRSSVPAARASRTPHVADADCRASDRVCRSRRTKASSSLQNGSAMTHACCVSCRIRFTPAAAAYLTVCPGCSQPLQRLAGPAGAVGYRLFRLEDTPRPAPDAIEVSIPIPDGGSGRS